MPLHREDEPGAGNIRLREHLRDDFSVGQRVGIHHEKRTLCTKRSEGFGQGAYSALADLEIADGAGVMMPAGAVKALEMCIRDRRR